MVSSSYSRYEESLMEKAKKAKLINLLLGLALPIILFLIFGLGAFMDYQADRGQTTTSVSLNYFYLIVLVFMLVHAIIRRFAGDKLTGYLDMIAITIVTFSGIMYLSATIRSIDGYLLSWLFMTIAMFVATLTIIWLNKRTGAPGPINKIRRYLLDKKLLGSASVALFVIVAAMAPAMVTGNVLSLSSQQESAGIPGNVAQEIKAKVSVEWLDQDAAVGIRNVEITSARMISEDAAGVQTWQYEAEVTLPTLNMTRRTTGAISVD